MKNFLQQQVRGVAMARKTTARDVAPAADASASTVDRELNGRGDFDPDQEKRVIEWARQLNLDRALRHRVARKFRIAVLIQSPDNPFIVLALPAADRVEWPIPRP